EIDPATEPEVEIHISRVLHEAETQTWIAGLSAGDYRLIVGANLEELYGEVRPITIEQTITMPRKEPLRVSPRIAPPRRLHRVEMIVRTASGLPLDGLEGRASLVAYSAHPNGFGRLEW